MKKDNLKSVTPSKNILWGAVLFSILLVGSKVIAGIWVSPLAWGIDFGSYLPSYFLIAYCLFSIIVISLIKYVDFEKLLSAASTWMEKKPRQFIGSSILLFIAVAFVFRIQTPLLGDSFVLVNNYTNTFKGGHQLYIVREPLAIIYYYVIMGALGTYTYPALTWAFFSGEMLLGSLFIMLVYGIVKEIALQPKERFLLYLFLLLLPSTELFFGYVEVYAVVLFSLSLLIYAALRFLNGKLHFLLLVASYYLLVCVHMVAIIMFPAIVYLGWLEFQKNGWKNIIIGAGIGFAGLLLLIFGATETFRRVLPENDQPHYLSLFPIHDDYNAYTLFSPYHFSEIGNLLLLVCPFAIFFTVIALFGKKKNLINSAQKKFFLLSAAGVLAFILIAKFELAMSKDWDVSTPWLFLLQCYGAIVFLQLEYGDKIKAFVLILLVSVCHSLLWYTLNSTVEPNINRVSSLRDNRVFSREANFLATMHLARYNYLNGNRKATTELWEQFTKEFPDYSKGYYHLITVYADNKTEDPAKVERALQQWVKIDPANKTARDTYISLCFGKIDQTLSLKDTAGAEKYYKKILELDSTNTKAYNNMANLYGSAGRLREAIPLYETAIKIDSNYLNAYNNLAKTYVRAGDYRLAISLLQKIVSKDSTYIEGYKIMANLYYMVGDRDKSLEMRRRGSAMEQRNTIQKQ
ncbi:MAG: tetratricopeptide repeat protein [Bacteroidota bacterium]